MPAVINNSTLSSSFSAKTYNITDGHPEEHFWGCQLTKENPSITWSFTEEEGDVDFLFHTLFLRHAVLGAGAVKDERNLVQVETKNFEGEEIKQPLMAMTLGKSDMCSLDINFSHKVPVTFTLIEGSGPVFLSAQQLVEFPPDTDEDEEDEYEYTEGDATATDTDGEVTIKKKATKRKAGALKGKSKKGKMDTSAASTEGTEGTEDEEDEDEEEGDESMEATEDSGEEEEEEEESEEEESDEEETPEKKKGKGVVRKPKGKAALATTKKGKTTPKGKGKKASVKKGKK